MAAVPGDDGDVQDEEGETGGGRIQPRAHQRPALLPGPGPEDVRPSDGGDPRRHRCRKNEALTET